MTDPLVVIATTLTLYAAVVVSPGPNFALVTRLAVGGARPAAIGASFGFAVAATLYAVLTMTGLALVLTRLDWLADAVQVAGGAYLVYLGVTAWASARSGDGDGESRPDSPSALRGLRTGMLVNLSNPKGIAFFIGLYAAAIPPGTPLWAKSAILAGGFLLEIAWYGLVTVALSSPPARRVYDRIGRWIERAVGAVLAAFGLRLMMETLS
ncbi:MAG: LysE family transporter [Azospirillaceae bacterium]